jgi:cytoskeletal protein CcmA (bactofilin family)
MATRASGWRRRVLGAPAADVVARLPEAEPGAPEAGAARIEFGAEMSGRLVVERGLHIDGEFRGELESAGSVFVSETGAVVAQIRARSVEIHGAVVGDVTAAREVVIHATGRLHGDVETPSLVVARGAVFNGRTRMYRPERSLEPDAPAAAATPGS